MLSGLFEFQEATVIVHAPETRRYANAEPVRTTLQRPARFLKHVVALFVFAASASSLAQTVVPLNANSGLSTYYLTVQVGGDLIEDYLVDTGAGFMTITDSTLAHLQERGQARFLRTIEGHLADGRVLKVPVYLLDEIVIGQTCVLREVEAAVLPGASRGLFGLSALRRTSPFEFSIEPPSLRLSNCVERPVLAASTASAR